MDRNRVIFITDINRVIYPAVDFVIDSILSAGFNRLPGIIYIIIRYILFVKFKTQTFAKKLQKVQTF